LCAQWVNDVLIDAPYVITEELIQTLRISLVVTGPVTWRRQYTMLGDSSDSDSSDDNNQSEGGVVSRRGRKSSRAAHKKAAAAGAGAGGSERGQGQGQGQEGGPEDADAYALPKEMGILRVLPWSEEARGGVMGFVQRIHRQRARFTEKYVLLSFLFSFFIFLFSFLGSLVMICSYVYSFNVAAALFVVFP
jgi:hypothetical protein